MPEIEQLARALTGRYTIDRQVGRGGMATVFLAHDLKHDREVAIKVLHPELTAAIPAERFHREIRIQAKLRHPHVVPLLDSGEANGLLYYIMPFVDGETLRQRLARGRLDIAEAIRLWRDVVDGIAYAHRHDVAHRDIKPENVLIADRHAMVADFGVAKALSQSTVLPGEQLTSAGMAIGTPGYMSPEQVSGSGEVDQRSDIYALGVLAYEMCTGEPPFTGNSPHAVFMAHMTQEPRPVEQLRPDLPPTVVAAIRRCMEKDPEKRWTSADELLAVLESVAAPLSGIAAFLPTTIRGRRTLASIAAGVVLTVGAGGWAYSSRQARVRWARETGLPELRRQSDALTRDSAFVLASRLRDILPGDSELDTLWRRNTTFARLATVPSGARVSWASYSRDTAGWTPIGVTPLDSVPVPAIAPSVLVLLKVEHPGHATAILPVGAATPGNPVTLALAPAGDTAAVRVTPRFVAVLDASGRTRQVRLGSFAIDRLEVTNAEFRRFVEAGGYSKRELWEPFILNGRFLSWEAGIARFTDRTGRPGPATWEGGVPPAGQERFPVAGVSWYEAMAYAKFAGKALPTVHQWRAAAGLARSPLITPLSNIGGTAMANVGSFRGMGPFGTFDMAGNAREWCVNAEGPAPGARRYVLGGGWNDVPWAFTHSVAADPFDRAPTNGIRLVRALEQEPDAAFLAAPMPRGQRDYSRERGRSEAEVRGYLGLFGYDERPLRARIESADSSNPSFIHQVVSFDAAYDGDRVRMHLLLPRNATPPFQTVVYAPGATGFSGGSSHAVLPTMSFLPPAGRAVAFPVVRHMYERATESVNFGADAVHNFSGGLLGPNTYRDEVIKQIKDIRRAVDYLATRPEIDTTRLAYSGLSWGGRVSPMLLAAEPRFRTAVLYIPGLLTAPRLPEVDEINFLSSVRVPVLVLSGRYDDVFQLESTVLPFVQRLGTPADHKRHVVYPTQHFLPRTELISETLNWLDRYFGPTAK